jgi:hypothetical protein
MCFTLVSVYVHTVDLVTLANILNSHWEKLFKCVNCANRVGNPNPAKILSSLRPESIFVSTIALKKNISI